MHKHNLLHQFEVNIKAPVHCSWKENGIFVGEFYVSHQTHMGILVFHLIKKPKLKPFPPIFSI